MSTDFDVMVIGGGPAGEHCAGALAEGGLRVAIVERELLGGECSYWACIPSKTLLRPGEALPAAREAPGAAQAVAGRSTPRPRSRGATSWSRTTTTPDRRVAGERGHRGGARRRRARRAGPGARRRGRATGQRRRARHRLGRRHPAGPGLRELDGVWTNREATGSRRCRGACSCSAAARSGVEMARRSRGWAARSRSSRAWTTLLAREPEPLGEALGEALARRRHRALPRPARPAARRDGDEYVLELADGTRAARRPAAGRHRAARRAPTASASRRSASSRASAGSRSTRACAPATACGRSAT